MPTAIRRLSPPDLLVAGAVAVFAVYFSVITLGVHHGLGTSSYDSALYDQGVWLLSRFDAPFVTLMGRNLFGDHSSFVLVFLVPLYWVAPGAWILFVSQATAVALGAVPVYWHARRRLGAGWPAAVMALVYLGHPALSWTVMENFHPDSFTAVFVAGAIWAATERRWRPYAVCVVLALLVKEDVALVVVPLGIWVALERRWRVGVATVIGSIGFMLVAMFAVMRSLIGVPTRNTWRIPFEGPTGFIRTALTDPTRVIDHLRSDGRLWYLWQMLAPVGFVFLRAPGVALISGLVLFTNILSTFWYQYQIEYHYSLIAVPAIVMGATWAISAMRSEARRRALVLVVAATAVTSALWSPMPWSRVQPGSWGRDHPVAVSARDVVGRVPDGVSVAAHHRLTPHLAYRSEIYQFPNPFRVVLYGVDNSLEGTRLADRADGVDYVVVQRVREGAEAYDFASIEVAFDLEYSNEHWEIWRRDRTVELPEP